jgi:DNA-binding protein H-NS
MATLAQIQAKIDKLKAQAEALAAKKSQAAVEQIRGLMLRHGLTTKDIEANAKTKRAAKAINDSTAGAVKASKKSGGTVAAKYRDPKSGATWTGRGRAPAWIANAKDRSKFLIGGAEVATPIAKTSKPKAALTKAAVKKAAVKKAAVKKAPVVKKIDAAKQAVVAKSSATSEKVAAKKPVVSSAKPKLVKKAAARKTSAVTTVAAKTNTPAAPVASVEAGV